MAKLKRIVSSKNDRRVKRALERRAGASKAKVLLSIRKDLLGRLDADLEARHKSAERINRLGVAEREGKVTRSELIEILIEEYLKDGEREADD